jgi:primosomal protein N' (replication factor Y)
VVRSGDSKFIDVAVDSPVDQLFTYKIPEELKDTVKEGMILQIPFGRRKASGYVVNLLPKVKEGLEVDKIKNFEKLLLEFPLFTKEDMVFLNKVSKYYHYPLGAVMRNAHPKIMKRLPKPVDPSEVMPSIGESPFDLGKDQKYAVDSISSAIKEGGYKPFLLEGITGSGKTEVYLQSIAECLNSGKSALLLVPEIALTPQLINRVSERFGENVALLHSAVSSGERFKSWVRILRGELKIAVGARSSIFAPFRDLGLIIVDEEHENSFKQEDRLRYNAKDIALMRASHVGATVVLGSATPSLETLHLVETGRVKKLKLTERATKSKLPETRIVDLRKHTPPEKFLSSPLIESIQETLARKEQVILFVNRRGYSSFIICKDCGETVQCENCSVTLTHYKTHRNLRCHYCGYNRSIPETCDACKGSEIKSMGFGTEAVEEEVKKLFPAAEVERFDRDRISRKGELEEILDRFQRKEINILIGTQMIAKGHDFPSVTLVGVILADLSLALPDFRSNERTFQLITQVSGRAGRGDLPGKVILQTYNPSHPVIITGSTQNTEEFSKSELEMRKRFNYPPFRKFALARFTSEHETYARDGAKIVAEIARSITDKMPDVDILGPGPAPLEKIKREYRHQIMFRAEKASTLNAFLNTLIGALPHPYPKKLGKIIFDVDPQSTL